MWSRMSRDYRLRVFSPYFLYLYVQKYECGVCGPPVAVGPCALHTLHILLLRHCLFHLQNYTVSQKVGSG